MSLPFMFLPQSIIRVNILVKTTNTNGLKFSKLNLLLCVLHKANFKYSKGLKMKKTI